MADLQQMHGLPEPTYCRLKHSKDPALLEKLDYLENIVAVLKSSQKQQDKIMSEAKLLQIMIYKRRQQLRSEKSLQLVRRVQACLKRASTFGRLFTLVDDIHKDLLSAAAEMKKTDVVYLPAQQTWSYLLYLQLQYVKLLDINCSYCITAFNHLSCQFATGMLIPQMVVFMGIVARIWLLSRSIAKKIQNCYSLVYPLRQHFDRTNSTWKEPVLPPYLQQSSPEDDCSDVQEMYNIASKVPASDSMEIAETGSLAKVLKNTMLALDEEIEDIGVPVALTRTNHSTSSDNRSNKRKGAGENDFMPYKKRKQMNNSSKQDDVAVVSSKSNFSFTPPDMPAAKKKKKKQLEKFPNMEVKPKKNNVQNESVKSSAPEGVYNVESIHTHKTSIVSDVPQKKHKKKKTDVPQKKHKKNKIKVISDGHVKLNTEEVGKRTTDSPKKNYSNETTKTGYESTEREDMMKKKDTVTKSHKRKKFKKSKLKKKKHVNTT